MQGTLKKILKAIHLSESTLSTFLGAFVVIVVGILIFNYIQQAKKVEQISEGVTTEEEKKVGEVAVETTEEGKLVPISLPVDYEVKEGDNLWKIAEANYGSGYNWVDIAQANNLAFPDYLLVEQKLNLPKVEVKLPIATEIEASESVTISSDTYKVQEGDNLWDIAVRAYGDGYKWPDIAQANNLANPDFIEVEQDLKLPR